MERAHLESEIQQVLPPLLHHPSAGVLSSRGWGLTAPCDESQSHPSRPIRSSSARPQLSCFLGAAEWKQGVDRSKTPPPHIRESESISLSSAFRHAYSRPFSLEDRYRNSLPALRDLRGIYDCKGRERVEKLQKNSIRFLQKISICCSTMIFAACKKCSFNR